MIGSYLYWRRKGAVNVASLNGGMVPLDPASINISHHVGIAAAAQGSAPQEHAQDASGVPEDPEDEGEVIMQRTQVQGTWGRTPPFNSSSDANQAYDQGCRLYELKDYQGAMDSYSECINANPRHAIFLSRATMRVLLSELAGAEADIYRAESLAEEWPVRGAILFESRRVMATLLCSQGLWEDAVNELEQAAAEAATIADAQCTRMLIEEFKERGKGRREFRRRGGRRPTW